MDRYNRQIAFAPLGPDGQRRLAAARVLIAGVGATGSVLAETLCRAGVGHLRLVDFDSVAHDNLQRQVLYDEADAREHRPKVTAAAERLTQINSEVEIEPIVAKIDDNSIDSLVENVDLILDGTDNYATRFVLNRAAVARRIPWIYAGLAGAEGQVFAIIPGKTACLQSILPEQPSDQMTPTAATDGVIGPIVRLVGAISSAEAIKLLSGHEEAVSKKMTVVDLWKNRFRQIDVSSAHSGDCPVCGHLWRD
jgi:molybdopterin-synthase adenylyltransferase